MGCFIVPANSVYGVVVIVELDEGVLILHDDVSDGSALLEQFFEVVSGGASGNSCDVHLGEIGIVWCSLTSTWWASASAASWASRAH